MICKDTPNFIGNRIGAFYGATTHKITIEDDYTVEEVDALTGPLIGLPKSAVSVCSISSDWISGLTSQAICTTWFLTILARALSAASVSIADAGTEVARGEDRSGLLQTRRPAERDPCDRLEDPRVSPAAKPKFASLSLHGTSKILPKRLRTLVDGQDRVGNLSLEAVQRCICVLGLDDSRDFGPHRGDRSGDALGVRAHVTDRLSCGMRWDSEYSAIGSRVKAGVCRRTSSRMRQMGAASFYKHEGRARYTSTCSTQAMRAGAAPGMETLATHKRARGVVKSNAGASLVDVGDGVLCLEFHSKMNSLGEMRCRWSSPRRGNGAKFRSSGARKRRREFQCRRESDVLLLAAQEGEWDELNDSGTPLPVGEHGDEVRAETCGGCAIRAGARRRVRMGAAQYRAQASAEVYMGLVEVGVGLIPAGGGCKEMILRLRGSANGCLN